LGLARNLSNFAYIQSPLSGESHVLQESDYNDAPMVVHRGRAAVRNEGKCIVMSSTSRTVQFGDLPLSKFVRRLTFLSAMGVFLDGYNLSIIAAALLFVEPLFHPTSVQLGFIGSAAVLGMLVGALVFGNLTDRFGRRTMYLFDLLFFIVFAILSALSQNIWELIIFRFLLGIGLGADYPISSTLTAEFAPTKRRGLLLVFTIGAWPAGATVAYLVSLALLHTGPNAWRFMLGSGAVIALLVMWARRTIPESPRWLAASGRQDRALDVATRIANDSGVQLDADQPELVPVGLKRLASFKQLFSPALIRMTVFVSLGWFLFDIGSYGAATFLPTILKDIKGTSTTDSLLASTGVWLLTLIVMFGVAALVEVFGRKWFQTWGFVALAIVFFFMGIITHLPFTAFVILYLLWAIANEIPGTLTYVFAGEVFPTSVRASGHGFATASSRFGAFLGTLFFPIVIAAVGLGTGFIIFAILNLLGALVTAWLAPEPKGRALPQEVVQS
jgi:putative MFS transporter